MSSNSQRAGSRRPILIPPDITQVTACVLRTGSAAHRDWWSLAGWYNLKQYNLIVPYQKPEVIGRSLRNVRLQSKQNSREKINKSTLVSWSRPRLPHWQANHIRCGGRFSKKQADRLKWRKVPIISLDSIMDLPAAFQGRGVDRAKILRRIY